MIEKIQIDYNYFDDDVKEMIDDFVHRYVLMFDDCKAPSFINKKTIESDMNGHPIHTLLINKCRDSILIKIFPPDSNCERNEYLFAIHMFKDLKGCICAKAFHRPP